MSFLPPKLWRGSRIAVWAKSFPIWFAVRCVRRRRAVSVTAFPCFRRGPAGRWSISKRSMRFATSRAGTEDLAGLGICRQQDVFPRWTIAGIRDWLEPPQIRHPWAKQERSSVAETLGSMPRPQPRAQRSTISARGGDLKSRHGSLGLRSSSRGLRCVAALLAPPVDDEAMSVCR